MNLEVDEWSTDISNVTSVLKLWLRELPDPLFTMSQHQEFMDAASEHMSTPSYDLPLTRIRPFSPRERERAGKAHPTA